MKNVKNAMKNVKNPIWDGAQGGLTLLTLALKQEQLTAILMIVIAKQLMIMIITGALVMTPFLLAIPALKKNALQSARHALVIKQSATLAVTVLVGLTTTPKKPALMTALTATTSKLSKEIMNATVNALTLSLPA